MPVINRDHLAVKFRQNWLAKHPIEVAAAREGLDDSLTSLGWLQNLNIMNIGAPTPPASPQPEIEGAIGSDELKVNPNTVLNYGNIKQEPGTYTTSPTGLGVVERIDYKTNPYVKPPFSYATLICMAMKETKKSKITLSAIYNWITDNFMYYRVADPSWQNSIRHNLSLNKCFQKVPRRKDEPGKGGFWRINPEYNDMLENGVLKKRRASRDSTSAAPTKRVKKENDEKPNCSHAKGRKRCVEDNGEKALNGVDFSWNSILGQDITVDGMKIKTEDILNDSAHLRASPLMAMSPPLSEDTVDSLDDLLNDIGSNSSLSGEGDDRLGHDFLNLSVQGIKIEAPDWWSESMNGGVLQSQQSRLNTPIAPSPIPHMDESHPWEESQIDIEAAIAAFDVENLFDNIPSPAQSHF